MRSAPFCLLLIVIFNSCNYTLTTIRDRQNDSTGIEEIKLEEIGTDKAEENIELDHIMQEYLFRYNPVAKKAVFAIGVDTLSIALTHRCLMDSAIVIPSKYVGLYKLDSFVTHNFETLLTVKKNGVVITDTTIIKKHFYEFVDGSLKDYAVLFDPNIRSSNDSIFLNYSISIPLTDIGIGASAVILRDGSIEFIKR